MSNTSLVPVDLHFSRLYVSQRAGGEDGGRDSDIFHFDSSNRGTAIGGVAAGVAGSSGKQVVADARRTFTGA